MSTKCSGATEQDHEYWATRNTARSPRSRRVTPQPGKQWCPAIDSHTAVPHCQYTMSRTYRRIGVAGAVIAIAVATVVAVRHFSTAPARDPTASFQRMSTAMNSPDGLAGEFARLRDKIDATLGIAMSAVGSLAPPVVFGDWSSGPAWSTIKVPVVMTALRAPDSAGLTAEMIAAITQSDNAAAEVVWASLGHPSTAARKVEAVLAEFGDITVVEDEKVRPEYSAFGQTDWSLVNRVIVIPEGAGFCQGPVRAGVSSFPASV
jgi:hypothetical protein